MVAGFDGLLRDEEAAISVDGLLGVDTAKQAAAGTVVARSRLVDSQATCSETESATVESR